MTWPVMLWALWLGVLTSIHPCPLATNIAAVSFLAHRARSTHAVFLCGLLYTLGRTLAYVALAAMLVSGLTGGSALSRFLQQYMNQLLGPVLILLGMLLLELIGTTASFNLAGGRVQERAAAGGSAWALALGVLFAISFCPVSAGLFFGALVPLALKTRSILLLPLLYGVGTALPVLVFAFLLAFAARHVGRAYAGLTRLEQWLRLGVGGLFVGLGVYFCVRYIYLA